MLYVLCLILVILTSTNIKMKPTQLQWTICRLEREAQVDIRQVRDDNKKQCIIANLNINSQPNKFVEIKEWLRSDAFNIFSVQETKIDRTFSDSQLHVVDYNLFRRDRVKGDRCLYWRQHYCLM